MAQAPPLTQAELLRAWLLSGYAYRMTFGEFHEMIKQRMREEGYDV